MKPEDTRFTIVGLGLIGGSYARGLTKKGFCVNAIDTNADSIRYALEEKIIRRGATAPDAALLAEASLSFLGLTQGYISWGFMIAESRNYLATSWWTATFPGLCIAGFVLSLNIVSDFLRDIFDPRVQG